MTEFAKIISAHCPDGVEFKALGELLDYEQPGKYLVDSTAYDASYPTPVLTAGQTFVLGFTAESHGIYDARSAAPVIIFDDFTTAFKWVDFPFKAKSSAMKMLTPKQRVPIDFRFVFYAMECIRFTPTDHARHWISQYSTFRIPVPPLDVQREIVRILDHFTELEAALEAELEARRIQFATYRELLFNQTIDVQRVPMSELGEFFRGRRFTKSDVVESGISSIHYGEIYTRYGVSAEAAISEVREELRPQLRFAQPGDVVVAGVGETVEEVGKAVAWLGDSPVAIHDDCFAYRHKINPKFVAFYFQSAMFHAEKNKFVARAKVKRLSAESLGRISIPVLDADEQARIVEILEKFDALVNDLSVGLPAELVARRKQYEYYRDKLLTFEELVA